MSIRALVFETRRRSTTRTQTNPRITLDLCKRKVAAAGANRFMVSTDARRVIARRVIARLVIDDRPLRIFASTTVSGLKHARSIILNLLDIVGRTNATRTETDYRDPCPDGL